MKVIQVMLSFTEQAIFKTTLSIIIIVGTLAYILVVWVNYQDKKLRQNIASMFLFNLLIIDLANLIVVMPFSLTSMNGKWRLGLGWARTNAFLGTTIEIASVLALAIISLDRLAAVMKPFIYRARVTKHKAAFLTISTWLQAAVFSLVPIPFDWYVFNGRYMSCTFKSFNHQPPTNFYIYLIFFLTLNFLFSLLIVIGTYLYIFRVARSHRKKIAFAIIPRLCVNLKGKVNIEGTRQREIRTAGKILIVIGAFMVCHLPYASMRILELCQYPMNMITHNMTIAIKWMSYSKSALDPFIYFLLQKKFRKSFNRILFRTSIRSNRVSHDSRVAKCTWTTPIGTVDNQQDFVQSLPVAVLPCYPHDHSET